MKKRFRNWIRRSKKKRERDKWVTSFNSQPQCLLIAKVMTSHTVRCITSEHSGDRKRAKSTAVPISATVPTALAVEWIVWRYNNNNKTKRRKESPPVVTRKLLLTWHPLVDDDDIISVIKSSESRETRPNSFLHLIAPCKSFPNVFS